MSSSKSSVFQLRGCGHPQDDALPNTFLILKAQHYSFQMRYNLFLNSFGMVVKIAKIFSEILRYDFKCTPL